MKLNIVRPIPLEDQVQTALDHFIQTVFSLAKESADRESPKASRDELFIIQGLGGDDPATYRFRPLGVVGRKISKDPAPSGEDDREEIEDCPECTCEVSEAPCPCETCDCGEDPADAEDPASIPKWMETCFVRLGMLAHTLYVTETDIRDWNGEAPLPIEDVAGSTDFPTLLTVIDDLQAMATRIQEWVGLH